MTLKWSHTSPTFALTSPQNSFEYRAREWEGSVTVYQEYCPTREITKRTVVSGWPQAYDQAEQWARQVARG
jgi:hypothetical protein